MSYDAIVYFRMNEEHSFDIGSQQCATGRTPTTVRPLAAAIPPPSKDDAKEDEGGRRPRGEVGYDVHLGGAIAGLLWHLIPSVVCMPR